MKCEICQIGVDEESCCEICGIKICPEHSEINKDYRACHYCLGKRNPFEDRDEDDFAGTEM